MAYRNKTYVCFDGDKDIRYYRLMLAWKQKEGINFNFYDAHSLNYARDDSQVESIKRQLRERLLGTSVFIVLIGESTRYLYRFVRWEIEQAISLDLPIICVNLNGVRSEDENRCPPLLKENLSIHVSFNASIIQHALENWPDDHKRLRSAGKSGGYFYKPETYESLGL